MSVPTVLRSYEPEWRAGRRIRVVVHGSLEHHPETPCDVCEWLDRADAAIEAHSCVHNLHPLLGVIECADALIEAVDLNHDTKSAPGKYMVPWQAISDLRAAISEVDRMPPPSELSPSAASGDNCGLAPAPINDAALDWLRSQRKKWRGYAEAAVLEALIAKREQELDA